MHPVRTFGAPKRLIPSLLLNFLLLFTGKIWAVELVVIGATEQQKQLIGCVVDLAAEELTKLAPSQLPLVFVVLEHEQFLEARYRYRAFKTEQAFSSLASGRIYLSSYALADFETAVKYIAHELGHFAANSLFESYAENRAGPIKQKARQACHLAKN